MPDEVTEQSEPVITGAEEAVVGAPEGVAGITVESVAGDSAAVAETPVTFDLSTDDGIRQAAEANPTLKGYFSKVQADAANAALQRFQAEQRRNEGTLERAQQTVRWAAEQLSNGVGVDEVARAIAPHVSANEGYTRTEIMRALLKQAGELGDETAAGLAASLEGSPEEVTKAAQVTLDAAIKRARSDERTNVQSEVDAAYQRGLAEAEARFAAEKEALEKEASLAAISTGPAVMGSGPGMTSTVDPLRERAMRDGIPIVDESARKQLAAALGVSL